MKDARGAAVSTSSAQALKHFETALTQFHGYTGDPLATMQQALQADPEFVLAHLFNAFAMITAAEKRYVPAVRDSVAKASALKAKLNTRERALLAAAELLLEGKWRDASRAFDAVLIEYLRDALAIQTAHLLDFFQGDALNLRNRISRVLPYWSERTPGYSYILGMHAFGLEECNQYADAERAARRALELQPRDGHAVHAVTHVMEMQGRIAEGERFERIAGIWAGKLKEEAGFYAFNDVHAMMSFAATGRTKEIARLRRAMRSAAKGSESNAAMTREVGLPIVDGFATFAQARYAETIDVIEPVRDIAHRFGGSHAQRDLLTLTLIEASIRGGDQRRARHYIAERQTHKPTAWSERLLSRSHRAAAAIRVVPEPSIEFDSTVTREHFAAMQWLRQH